MQRIDELCEKLPSIPRPIVIKTDVLREGVRFTPLALEIGKWAIPEFLPWDREVHKDYAAIEDDLVGPDWAWLPHSMTFAGGITAKVLHDFIRHHESPYEMRRRGDAVWLHRDGEPLVEITFEKRPEWLSRRMPDGRQMASVFVLASPDRLLGFPIRFCAYYQPEDVCRFCCLNPAGKNIAKGDGYLFALNAAIAEWGRIIYIRPMAEMNNKINYYSYERKQDADHHPEAYKRAFCRTFILLHGGKKAQVNAKLAALGLPPVSRDLAVNPYPTLRVIWNPVAGLGGHAKYYPGDRCNDMVDLDIYSSGSPSALDKFAAEHRNKQMSIPEWGLEGEDDPDFVNAVCRFIKSYAKNEMATYFESKPGSIYDLGSSPDKPKSRKAYRACITPYGGPPPGQAAAPGAETIPALPLGQMKLTPDPATGLAPLEVRFDIAVNIPKIVGWEIAFGDGQVQRGNGTPPDTAIHTYAKDGVYTAFLIVYTAPPFTGTAIRFLTSTKVEVGDEPGTLLALRPSVSSGKAPLKVSFRLIANPPSPIVRWQLLFGDGATHEGTGKPPSFVGHTYQRKGSFRAVLIVYPGPPYTGTVVRFLSAADIRVT